MGATPRRLAWDCDFIVRRDTCMIFISLLAYNDDSLLYIEQAAATF